MKLFNKLWERFVVWGYERTGLNMGDVASYGYMSQIGFLYAGPDWEMRHRKWRSWYCDLGYKIIDDETWMLAGGYGKPYKHLLRVRDVAPDSN